MNDMKDLKDYLNESIEVTVYNAEGTTSDPNEYGYASWRDYWEDHNHSRNDESLRPIRVELTSNPNAKFTMKYRCPMCGNIYHWDGELPDCFDGCHVIVKEDADDKLYLTPLCHSCNKKDGIAKVPRRMLEIAPSKKNK